MFILASTTSEPPLQTDISEITLAFAEDINSEPTQSTPQEEQTQDTQEISPEDMNPRQDLLSEPLPDLPDTVPHNDSLSDIPAEPVPPVAPLQSMPQIPKKDTKPTDRPKAEVRPPGSASSTKSLSAAAQFNACLQAKAKYPTSKEARLQNPHGTVGVLVKLSGAVITAVTITESSGSGLLDQAARAGILSSDCGGLAAGLPSLTGRIVF